jgi:hypothetical protein
MGGEPLLARGFDEVGREVRQQSRELPGTEIGNLIL